MKSKLRQTGFVVLCVVTGAVIVGVCLDSMIEYDGDDHVRWMDSQSVNLGCQGIMIANYVVGNGELPGSLTEAADDLERNGWRVGEAALRYGPGHHSGNVGDVFSGTDCLRKVAGADDYDWTPASEKIGVLDLTSYTRTGPKSFSLEPVWTWYGDDFEVYRKKITDYLGEDLRVNGAWKGGRILIEGGWFSCAVELH